MRPITKIANPNLTAALDNTPEASGITSLIIDDISVRVLGAQTTFARKRLAKQIDKIKRDEQDSKLIGTSPELRLEMQGELARRASKFGDRLVRLTESKEHYSRFRHNGGSQMSTAEKNQNAFLVAADQIKHLAQDALVISANDDQVADALITSSTEIVFAAENFDTGRLAGAVTLGAISELEKIEA